MYSNGWPTSIYLMESISDSWGWTKIAEHHLKGGSFWSIIIIRNAAAKIICIVKHLDTLDWVYSSHELRNIWYEGLCWIACNLIFRQKQIVRAYKIKLCMYLRAILRYIIWCEKLNNKSSFIIFPASSYHMNTKNAFNPACAAMRHGEVFSLSSDPVIARLYGFGMTMEWGSSIVQNNATLFPHNVPIFQNDDALKQIEEWFHKHQDDVKFIPWSDLHVL